VLSVSLLAVFGVCLLRKTAKSLGGLGYYCGLLRATHTENGCERHSAEIEKNCGFVKKEKKTAKNRGFSTQNYM
jgi:hypothetical protein